MPYSIEHTLGKTKNEIIDALREANIDHRTHLDPNTKLPLLHSAAKQGAKVAIEALLEYGAEIDAITPPHQWTPLHFASDQGKSNSVKLLLERNANPKAKTTNGSTALHLAAFSGKTNLNKAKEVIHYLLEQDPTLLDECNNALETPLQTLLAFVPYDSNIENIALFLLERSRTSLSGTLHYAVRNGYERVVDALLARNPNLLTTDTQGNTVFHLAAKGDNPTSKAILTKLLEAATPEVKGVVITKPNTDGQTVIELFKRAPYKEGYALLGLTPPILLTASSESSPRISSTSSPRPLSSHTGSSPRLMAAPGGGSPRDGVATSKDGSPRLNVATDVSVLAKESSPRQAGSTDTAALPSKNPMARLLQSEGIIPTVASTTAVQPGELPGNQASTETTPSAPRAQAPIKRKVSIIIPDDQLFGKPTLRRRITTFLSKHWWKLLLVATLLMVAYAVACVFVPPLLFGLPLIAKASGLLLSAGLSATSPALLPICAVVFGACAGLVGAFCFGIIMGGKKLYHKTFSEQEQVPSNLAPQAQSKPVYPGVMDATLYKEERACLPFRLLGGLRDSCESNLQFLAIKAGLRKNTTSYVSLTNLKLD